MGGHHEVHEIAPSNKFHDKNVGFARLDKLQWSQVRPRISVDQVSICESGHGNKHTDREKESRLLREGRGNTSSRDNVSSRGRKRGRESEGGGGRREDHEHTDDVSMMFGCWSIIAMHTSCLTLASSSCNKRPGIHVNPHDAKALSIFQA